jgi:hypothetical protein
MPEDLLDVLETRPAHHEMACGRVAEVVGPTGHDAGPGERRLEGRPDLGPAPVVPVRKSRPRRRVASGSRAIRAL